MGEILLRMRPMKAQLPTITAVLWTAMKAEVVCFLVATVILWLREIMTSGGIELINPEAAMLTWGATLVVSLVLLWRHRSFGIVGLGGFFLFGVLVLSPRL